MGTAKYWIVPGIIARFITTGEKVRVMNVMQATYRDGETRKSRVYGVNCAMIERKDEPVARIHTNLLQPLEDKAS